MDTWVFYVPMIIFFVIIVIMSIVSTYRTRAAQRRLVAQQGGIGITPMSPQQLVIAGQAPQPMQYYQQQQQPVVVYAGHISDPSPIIR
jgi:hypothetical protein